MLTLTPLAWKCLIDFIADVETLVTPSRHLDDDKPDVITGGYGCTDSRVMPVGKVITPDEAKKWLYDDLDFTQKFLNGLLPRWNATPGQSIAVMDLCYNIGVGAFANSTLKCYLELGDVHSAVEEFPKWNHANGKILEGLVKRRAVEVNWFLSTSLF